MSRSNDWGTAAAGVLMLAGLLAFLAGAACLALLRVSGAGLLHVQEGGIDILERRFGREPGASPAFRFVFTLGFYGVVLVPGGYVLFLLAQHPLRLVAVLAGGLALGLVMAVLGSLPRRRESGLKLRFWDRE